MGLELVIGLFDFDRAEHAGLCIIRLAAGFPEVEAHDVRGVDRDRKPRLRSSSRKPVFDDLANQAALGIARKSVPGRLLP